MFKKKLTSLLTILCIALFFLPAQARENQSSIKFTVTMEDPQSHYYHVELRCEGFSKDKLNFKLPAWTPGYYWIMDFAKNVIRFKAETNSGKELEWDKVDKNNWEVKANNAGTVIISYDVFANTHSVADPFIDSTHAYLSTAGLFMHIAGELKHPVQVVLKPYRKWTTISTGLDPVRGVANTYLAPDFDTLYDSPIYIGNQKTVSFEVKGVTHTIAMESPDMFDTVKFAADLKRIVIAGTDLMEDIPYKHYTFIIMGPGNGGLEHRNSTAVFSSANYMMKTKESYHRWLSFLSHEYFHLYNIKAIRPIALGPFNYDKENLTHMLWVSEGFTVYYEYMLLNRAGLLTRDEFLHALTASITNYENIPGHQVQSATASSYDTWIQFFNKNENAANTTISYYDKGCAMGLLLDLKIRQETKNKKSLDDVMRTLYKEFYQDKKRGFTDQEFRQVCERIAGTSLQEIFTYASTVKEVDYQKYLDYAGLKVDMSPLPVKEGGAPKESVAVKEETVFNEGTAGNDQFVKRSFEFSLIERPGSLQRNILKSMIR